MSSWTQGTTGIELTINDTNISLTLNDAKEVLGVAGVTQNGVALRGDKVLLRPLIKSITGVEYSAYRLEEVKEEADGAICIRTTAIGEHRLEMPYGDQYNDHLLHLSDKATTVEDTLEWVFRPESISFGTTAYEGFSYAFRFTSKTQEIHRILVVGSWEIDGKATGNTILSQGQVTPAVYEATPETHFTSACLQSLERFGDPCAMSFQFCPRYGVQQCFDFLGHEKGTLIGYWDEKNDTRSFIQKSEEEETFFVVDALHDTASKEFSQPRKIIVFAPSGEEGMPEHVMRNRWKDAYDACCKIYRDLFDIKKSEPMPERTIPFYSEVTPDRKLRMKVGDTWVASQEWMIAVADTMFENLAKGGIKRVIMESVVESDPTQRGFPCKLDQGIHGDWDVGSVCCVHRYRPAELFGGMKGWRYMADKAHSLGMEIGHWVGPHLAHHAPILKEHPDWAVKTFATLDFSGGYPNFVLSALDWNTPVREWIVNDLKAMHDEGGLDYIWFDSFSNLGLLPVDFSKKMCTNANALLEFFSDVQKAGIPNIAVEGMSPVAMSGAFIMDHEPGHDGGVQSIAGQNSWLWYEGNEDMLCDQQSRTWVYKGRTEENVAKRVFRCIANHFAPLVTEFVNPLGSTAEWYTDYCNTYCATKDMMVNREILPEKKGVVWTSPQGTLLFAFKDLEFTVPSAATKVCSVKNGEDTPLTVNGTLSAKAYTAYRMS